MVEDTVVVMEVLVVGVAEEVALVQVEAPNQVVQRVGVQRAEEVLNLVVQNLTGVLQKLEALTVVSLIVVVRVQQVLTLPLNLTLHQKQTQNLTQVSV